MDNKFKKLKICRVATVPFVFQNHLFDTILKTMAEGHVVTLVCSDDKEITELKKISGLKIVTLNIEREISIFKDLISLIRLIFFFLTNRFDVVHSVTQKAGLLSALAGFVTRIPIRLHTFTGQPWMFKKGLVRFVSKKCDWLMTFLNTMCYADSRSQKQYLIDEGVGKDAKISVLGSGSLAGVDTKKFRLDQFSSEDRLSFRKELNIPKDSFVINFTGRINSDKGFTEYIEAFQNLIQNHFDVYWVIVGPFEEKKDPLPREQIDFLESHERIRLIGYTKEPQKYFYLSDVFCMPSYREGFGNVVIEAACLGLPTVATKAVGLMDSVVDGHTGLLVPLKDSQALFEALKSVYQDKDLLKKLGRNANERALQEFDKDHVIQLVMEEYQKFYYKNHKL